MLRVGWLRDLMQLSEPPMQSFGRLADTCLEHTDWPAAVEIQSRSLATLFSKLDREIDLDWLRDRAEVQRVICRVLGRPLGDLRVALGEPATLIHGRRVRLADARFARELDLGREALPPGIPERALSPPSWQGAYWVAPAGAGKSLAGAWLHARGLAEHVRIEHDADWASLPSVGALFIELAPRIALRPRTAQALLGRASPVCVASPEPLAPDGFATFHSPPIDEYLSALVEWLAARLDGTGHFSASRAETWIKQVALPHRAVLGFGEVLGLLGALDEFSPQGLRGKSLDDLGRSFVEKRLSDALIDTSWGPAASAQAFAALGQAAARCLVEPDVDLAAPRTLDAWADLLATSREAPDEEWLVRAMRLADDDRERGARMARAARRLPPSGYRIARSLALGGLLVGPAATEVRADAELSLRPHWLVSLLSARANGTALEMSPSEWGAALLDSRKREELEIALLARFLRGHFTALETLLDQLDPTEPSHLAALDASLRQLAEVELLAEPIPDDLKADLLTQATDLLVRIGAEIVPTLPLAGARAHRAAIAALSTTQPLRERELDPHRTSQPAIRATFAEDCAKVAASSDRRVGPAWLLLSQSLNADSAKKPFVLSMLEALISERRPARSMEALEHESFRDVSPAELDLVLRTAIQQIGDAALERAWDVFGPHTLEKVTNRELLHKLWLRVPPALLPELATRGQHIEFASLLPHHFVAWLKSGVPLPLAAATHCPLEAMHEAVTERGPACVEPDALALILTRSPRLVRILVDRLGTESADDAPSLAGLPGRALGELCEALPPDAELLRLKRPALDRIRALLVMRIERLGPGVELAVARLRALEMALGPLRR